MPPTVSQQDAVGNRRHLLLHRNGRGELKGEHAGGVIDETLSFEIVFDTAW